MKSFILFIGGTKDGTFETCIGDIAEFRVAYPEYKTVVKLADGQDICIGRRVISSGANVYAVGLTTVRPEDLALVLCNAYVQAKLLVKVREILA